jgi:hypothetical protein
MKNRKLKKNLQVQMQWSFSLNNFGVRLSLQSWRWCLRCWSVVVSSKGMHKVEQNLSTSSQAVWAQATSSLGALLVSLFNVKWRFSVPAGGVEGSKFCLFSVALPAWCVSSVSPRFRYRRHAFCFLTLATILEFMLSFLLSLMFSLQQKNQRTRQRRFSGEWGRWPKQCIQM